MSFRALMVVIVLAGSLPFAAASSHVEMESVEGRTILFDLTRLDPDLAAVAGHAKGSSSWFDGTIVFDKDTDGFVYAVPSGSGDPTGKTLFPTGAWYNFTDDNGATWQVQEWYYLEVEELQYMLGGHVATEKIAHKTHVWTVRTAAEPIRDSTQGVFYNFVVVVDVPKLQSLVVGSDGESIPTVGEEPPSSGNIDLFFSQHDPSARCSGCNAPSGTLLPDA